MRRNSFPRTLAGVPEGHTIHRLAGRYRSRFAGSRVEVASPQGRFAAGAAQLTGASTSNSDGNSDGNRAASTGNRAGAVLRDTEAYGKHLLLHFDGDRTLHIHLGLYGKFTDGTVPPPDPVGQVRLRLTSGRHWLDLRGPTACELLSPPEVATLRARLGADPLRDDADPEAAYRRIRGSRSSLAALLLDQSVVAGPGLVYVSEVLFRAGLAPTSPGRALTPPAWQELWRDLCALMKEGVATGRIDTVHAAHMPAAMGRAPRMDRHGGEVYVYRRAGQPCLVCGAEVRRAGLAGRNSYWCPACQPTRGQEELRAA